MSDANKPSGEGSKEDAAANDGRNNEHSIDKYRGSRKVQDITVETYLNVGKFY